MSVMVKRSVYVVVGLVILIGVVVLGFLMSGGSRLVWIYTHYLIKDIPEKKYSLSDFQDRGVGQIISGYYAGTVAGGVYVWTFSGLKKYHHYQGTSVYYYVDTCETIRQLANRKKDLGEKLTESEAREKREMWRTFDLAEWRIYPKTGDYVWVKWVDIGNGRRTIDKIYASSNKYYPIEHIKVEQCEE